MEGETATATATATSTRKSIQILQDAIEQLSVSTSSNSFSPSHEFQIKSQHQTSPTANSGGDEAQILTELISQLESLKQECIINQSEPSADAANVEEAVDGKGKENEDAAEEIVKELRNVKRQNTVTHWLLSGLILVTVVCQLSEACIILKVRDGLNHPFSTIGSWLKGAEKRQAANGQDAKASSIKDTLVEFTIDKMSEMDLEPHTSAAAKPRFFCAG